MLQNFYRDVGEALEFVQQKMAIASDESYKDPANLRRKLRQFQVPVPAMRPNRVLECSDAAVLRHPLPRPVLDPSYQTSIAGANPQPK